MRHFLLGAAIALLLSVLGHAAIGSARLRAPIVFPESSFVISKLTGLKGQVVFAEPPCYGVRFLKPVGQPSRMVALSFEECMRHFELYKAEERG